MKTRHHLILGLAGILGLVSCKPEQKCTDCINNFEALRGEFAEPSKEYGTAPLYVWNTTITRELIDRTMADLKDKGFGGVFVHPRPGLVTEYISDEWYNLFRYTLDKGKQLGMNTWIYDENSYPSGFAGGHVPAQMPESYNQGQGLQLSKFEMLPDTAFRYFICMKEEGGKFSDITANVQTEAGKKGNYYLFSKTYIHKSPWYGGYSYVDLLYPGVTQKFIDVTMPGYERVAGDEFGKSMPGWFTDEPNIQTTGGIRWTPDLFDVFQKKWGYDLKTVLPSLYEETGDWKQVRHNYTQTLLQLFIDRWAKPCFEYCEARNLLFTGHYWEHGWPDVGHGGDNMAMYAWHQQPAIDMLFNQFNEESPQAQFGNVRSVKELSSVANQMGYRRALSETYGGGGWEETFQDFKRLGDWEYVLGVNFMNQHLSHLSISGARKYDYPPVFSDHSPWWPYYKPLNMHYARLSMALSAGEQLNDILILEPTTSIWLYYAYHNSNNKLWDIGRAFQGFVTTLEKAQAEYDLGSENIIKDRGRIDKGKFVVNKRAYSKVVLPPMMENIDTPTWKLLKKFIDNGGVVLSFSEPSHLDGKPDPEMQKYFAGKPNVKKITGLTADVIREDFASADITFAEAQGGKLFHHRRVMADGHVLFLVNSSLDEPAKGSVSLAGKDAVELNTLTGEMFDYPETADGNTVRLDFDLPPAGSLLLYVFDKKQNGFEQPVPVKQYTAVNAPSILTARPDGSNVLTIDFCDLQLDRETFRDLHVFDAADKAFKYHDFRDGNPWNTSVQYEDNIVRRDTFKTGGFKAVYHFTVAGNFDMSDMQAAVERPHLYKITLNGKEIKPEPGKWFLDRDMGVFAIGNAVKKGANDLAIELSPMKIHAELEPVYILGNFTVQPAAKGFTINPPVNAFAAGSWKAQGWPFYPGIVSYSKTFDVTDAAGHYRVSLGEWTGTVAAITVNGQQAGIVGFKPYILDVSKFIKQGANTVEVKVVGSNKNLLGPFHNRPAPGVVSPWNFRNVKAYPAGSDYGQLDYGLMGDFQLEEGK
ncbi:MAG: hypothetical protein LBL24_08370 [Bacteroidales bacterium]|jgi:hypothetical protein|nr:hypothetical protein [Bacteroidales bacterium]